MEKYKIELELTKKEIENIRYFGCLGLITGNDGRADDNAYCDMAKLLAKLNNAIGAEFGGGICSTEDCKYMQKTTLRKYVRHAFRFMFKLEIIEEEDIFKNVTADDIFKPRKELDKSVSLSFKE